MLVIASLHVEWTPHLERNPMQASDATIQTETTLKLATFGITPGCSFGSALTTTEVIASVDREMKS